MRNLHCTRRQKGRLGLQQNNSCLDCAERLLHDEGSFLQWFYDLQINELIVLRTGMILSKIFSNLHIYLPNFLLSFGFFVRRKLFKFGALDRKKVPAVSPHSGWWIRPLFKKISYKVPLRYKMEQNVERTEQNALADTVFLVQINPRTHKGVDAPPPPFWAFSDFFPRRLNISTSLSQQLFIYPLTNFETSLVMISVYDYEIWRHK